MRYGSPPISMADPGGLANSHVAPTTGVQGLAVYFRLVHLREARGGACAAINSLPLILVHGVSFLADERSSAGLLIESLLPYLLLVVGNQVEKRRLLLTRFARLSAALNELAVPVDSGALREGTLTTGSRLRPLRGIWKSGGCSSCQSRPFLAFFDASLEHNAPSKSRLHDPVGGTIIEIENVDLNMRANMFGSAPRVLTVKSSLVRGANRTSSRTTGI